MLIFSGSSQNPGSSVLDELQLSNALLCEEIITIINTLIDLSLIINKVFPNLDWNKTSNSCNVLR